MENKWSFMMNLRMSKMDFLWYFVCLVLAASCSGNKKTSTLSDYEKLSDYLKSHAIDKDTVRSILVVSETGCGNCNKSFSYLVKDYLNTPKTAVIVTANGVVVDLSPYKNKEQAIIDFENDFGKLNLIEGSGALFLETEKVDTIVPIEARHIVQSLSYIRQRLDARKDESF